MNLENAIRVAIEEGGLDRMWYGTYLNEFELVHSPEFWQALSKARGWKPQEVYMGQTVFDWKWYALRYFELRMTGQDEPKFWEDILK